MTLKKKHTMEERLPLILAFVIPILIMIGVFAGKSIYPFGEKSFLKQIQEVVERFENRGT